LSVPFATGWWFDQHTSYDLPLVVSLVAAAASAVVYAMLRQPKLPARLRQANQELPLS
jgi:hypothetical protein